MIKDCPFCHHAHATVSRAKEPEVSGHRAILECLECGCRYPDRRLSPSQSAEYFKHFDDEHFAAYDFEADFERGFEGTRRLLVNYVLPGISLPPGATALDIGSLSGIVPASLSSLGLLASGVETMDRAVDFARSKGIDVHQGVFPHDLPQTLAGTSFDLITCFEVLYYFHDLRQSLTGLRDMLAPGGFLAIKCLQGNAYYFNRYSYFSRYKENLQAIPTAKSLRYWLSTSGLELVSLRPLPEDWLGNAWGLALPDPLRKVQSLLNLVLSPLFDRSKADRFMVIARRKDS